ncbi:MAG: trypsin-like peptidase domain-containing protein, partial [Candidatus Brocadiae bacterium]|nr:trypsin-like peptidase domain-containing protein [Candidatus Brocadiia bacterium]
MKAKGSFAALFAAVLVIGLLLGGVLNVPAPAAAAREAETEAAENAERLDELRDFAGKLETLFESAAQAASPAVVSVTAIRKYRVTVRDPLEDLFRLDDLFGRRFGDRFRRQAPRERELERRVLGSGVILDAEGHILTNNHVVADATELQVKLADGRTFDAELAGSDTKTELAVIKIKGKPGHLPVAKLGDSDKIHVGQWVLAIGDPFGQLHTVSAGIISAKGRTGFGRFAQYEDWIQTDAAINPGNSGGPL